MNAMLTDEELSALLGDAARGFDVPPLELPVAPARRRVPRRAWVGGAAAAAALVLGGAAVLQSGGSHTFSDTAAKLPSRAFDGGGQLMPGSAEGGGTTGGTGAVPAPAVTGEVTSVGAGAQVGGDADGARVVKTGSLSLVVDEGRVSATVARVEVLVQGLQGYVSSSTSEEAGSHPSATVTVRVPVTRFEALVRQVRGLKAKVVSAETSGKDVTASYADTTAQIATLKAARARYLTILAGAKTIAETLTVQQRIDDVQGQIDRLEGQRRVLADQSDLGTLTVTVGERSDEVLATPARTGWSKAWHDATHGFTGGLQSLLAGSGTALLVLLVGAVVLLLGRLGWRRARRRLV